MDIEDVIIEDLFNFFTSLSSENNDTLLKSNNSIVPYLAFVISSNNRAYNSLLSKIAVWNSQKISSEYIRCPWINCKFITRMINIDRQTRIINILLFLCSNDCTDEEIFIILSNGWKRIALYIESRECIDINQAPLRKKTDDKWVLCFMSFLKHKMILQARNRDEWYKFSSELFFYYKFIIQRSDIDTLNTKARYVLSSYNNEMLYTDVDENIEYSHENILPIQLLLLLREKERIVKQIVCRLDNKESIICSESNDITPQKTIRGISDAQQSIHDETSSEPKAVYKQIEYFEKHAVELEKKYNEVVRENLRLKNELDLLSEEVCFLRVPNEEESIILEDECDWDYLHHKKIIICGGRLEWLNRIKQLFPQWKYIANDDIRFDGQLLKDSCTDAIVFNKRFVSHGLFYRVASQKARNIPLIYINSSNVEFSLQTICNKLKNMKEI